MYRPGREGRSFTIAYRKQRDRTVGQFGGELTRCVIKYDVVQGGTDRRTQKNRTWKADEVDLPFFQTGSDPVALFAYYGFRGFSLHGERYPQQRF